MRPEPQIRERLDGLDREIARLSARTGPAGGWRMQAAEVGLPDYAHLVGEMQMRDRLLRRRAMLLEAYREAGAVGKGNAR